MYIIYYIDIDIQYIREFEYISGYFEPGAVTGVCIIFPVQTGCEDSADTHMTTLSK